LRRENKGDDLFLTTRRRREQRGRHGSCRLWRREYRDEDLPLVCSEEEENKGDDIALADCGRESTEKTYLLYVVEKNITKTTTSMVM
jgi:hypothetical protein